MSARFAASILLSAVSGAVAVFLLADPVPVPATEDPLPSGELLEPRPDGGGGLGTEGLPSEIARYRAISQVEDAEIVEALVRAALARPRLPDRDAELEALLARLFELAPRRAADFAASLDLPRSLLQAVFQAWAETDLAAAVEQLDRVGAPSRELLFALTLLGAGDYDRTLLERLAEQSRTLDVARLEVAAIVEQARRDPVGAVSNARGLKGRAA